MVTASPPDNLRPARATASRRRAAVVAAIAVSAIALCGLLTPSRAPAQRTAPSEYQVKAAFLLNFVQFVEWPDSAFLSPEAPFVVAVLGDDPFGQILEETFADQSPHGRRVVIRRSRQVEDLAGSHLLFVSRSEKDRLSQVLASLRDGSVLTVGDIDDFARRGGVINFYFDESKIRFELNLDVAEHKKLRVHSQLLRRARVIGRSSSGSSNGSNSSSAGGASTGQGGN